MNRVGEGEAAYLALGSNMGDRADFLRHAITALTMEPSVQVTAISSVYETEPVGFVDQDHFLNTVVQIETSLEPHKLLNVTQRIEQMLHRKRDVRWGPRTLDIDIVLFGNVSLKQPQLTIPHPRMTERAFVLVPLSELAPHLLVPETGLTVSQLLEQVAGKEGVKRCPTISLAAEFGLIES